MVVKAINGNGESLPSAPVVGASSTGAQEPENVVVDRGGSGELVVRWSTPANDGQSPISGYVVQWKLSVDVFDEQSPVAELGEDARNHTITGLTNGVQYDVRVFAVNAHGRGEPSTPVRIIPGVVAGAPTGVVVTHGDGQLTVAWQPPSGGVTPDSYTVQWKPSTAQLWASSGNAESPHTVGGLTNGVQHDVRIIAVKDGLLSSPSGVASGTPSTLPGAPADVVLTPGDSEMTVNWNEPNDNGGASISAYIVQWKLNATPSWIGAQSANDTAPPHIIVDLENDRTYDVRVFALNLNGPGTPSPVASASPVGLALAGISTVTIAEETITSVSATVTVTIANQDEEPETVHLRYRPASVDTDWTEVGRVDTTTETSVDFSLEELDANTEYEVEASLDSDFPEGASPGTTFVTLSTVPDAPVNLIVVPGDEELSVSWSPPDHDGGADIRAYIVQWRREGQEFDESRQREVVDTTGVITDLSNGIEYQVRVFALNENGAGNPTDVQVGTPTESRGAHDFRSERE